MMVEFVKRWPPYVRGDVAEVTTGVADVLFANGWAVKTKAKPQPKLKAVPKAKPKAKPKLSQRERRQKK